MLVALRMVAGMPGWSLNMISNVQIFFYVTDVQVSLTTIINLIFYAWFSYFFELEQN